MAEHSSRDLVLGIVALVIGGLYAGVELYYRAAFGKSSEYFVGWWLAAFGIVLGIFLLLRSRSDRVRRLSEAVAESPYYNAFGILIGLVLASFGAWLAVLTGGDLGSESASWALGLGVFFVILGLVSAGLWFRRLRYA